MAQVLNNRPTLTKTWSWYLNQKENRHGSGFYKHDFLLNTFAGFHCIMNQLPLDMGSQHRINKFHLTKKTGQVNISGQKKTREWFSQVNRHAGRLLSETKNPDFLVSKKSLRSPKNPIISNLQIHNSLSLCCMFLGPLALNLAAHVDRVIGLPTQPFPYIEGM